MRSIRTFILTLHGTMRLMWKALPIFTALAGYFLFAPPMYLGAIFALVLGIAGVLAKYAAAQFERPVTHGSARFANLNDARKGKLLRRSGLILGRKSGRMLRYSGDGHLLTWQQRPFIRMLWATKKSRLLKKCGKTGNITTKFNQCYT